MFELRLTAICPFAAGCGSTATKSAKDRDDTTDDAKVTI